MSDDETVIALSALAFIAGWFGARLRYRVYREGHMCLCGRTVPCFFGGCQ